MTNHPNRNRRAQARAAAPRAVDHLREGLAGGFGPALEAAFVEGADWETRRRSNEVAAAKSRAEARAPDKPKQRSGLTITAGGHARNWYVGADGVQRWVSNNLPLVP